MKTIALVLVALIVASGVPARAQVAAGSAAKPVEKPKPTCVCDAYNFKPLTEKAKAVEAYWDARRTVKTAGVIGGLGLLFGLATRDAGVVNQSEQGYSQAQSKMLDAKLKAEQLGALKVTGDDLDGQIEIKLVKGVDYELTK